MKTKIPFCFQRLPAFSFSFKRDPKLKSPTNENNVSAKVVKTNNMITQFRSTVSLTQFFSFMGNAILLQSKNLTVWQYHTKIPLRNGKPCSQEAIMEPISRQLAHPFFNWHWDKLRCGDNRMPTHLFLELLSIIKAPTRLGFYAHIVA